MPKCTLYDYSRNFNISWELNQDYSQISTHNWESISLHSHSFDFYKLKVSSSSLAEVLCSVFSLFCCIIERETILNIIIFPNTGVITNLIHISVPSSSVNSLTYPKLYTVQIKASHFLFTFDLALSLPEALEGEKAVQKRPDRGREVRRGKMGEHRSSSPALSLSPLHFFEPFSPAVCSRRNLVDSRCLATSSYYIFK